MLAAQTEIIYKYIDELENCFTRVCDNLDSNIDDKRLFSKIDGIFSGIEKTYTSFTGSNSPHDTIKGLIEYYREKLHRYLLQSPFFCRCFQKDAGYAGDYEMMRMIHDNPYDGDTEFGKKLNSYFLGLSIPEAVRKRTRYITNRLVSCLSENRADTNIMSVACGPALEIKGLIDMEPGLADTLSLTLLDQDQNALDYCKSNLSSSMKHNNVSFPVTYISSRIEQYIIRNRNNKCHKKYSLIYSSGLFDYFNYKSARFIIRRLLSFLKPGGELIIANVSLDGHEQRAVMELGMDWHLVYRNKMELLDLADGMEGVKSISVDEIANGFVKFLTLGV